MGVRTRSIEEVVDFLCENVIPNGECLECHLAPSLDREGRARHYVSVGGRNGVKWRVTRLVWHVRKGPIPEGLWVLHTCDNSGCINLDHLFLGTPQDNTDDMIAKGRKVDDPNVPIRRKEATAKMIKAFADGNLSNQQIADKMGMSLSTVNNYLTPNGIYREFIND